MGSVKSDVLLDLLLKNKEELTGDVIIRVESWRPGFSVLRGMVSGIPGESALKGNRAQVS